MKKYFKTALMIIATVSVALSFAFKNNSNDIISDIGSAIKSGNAANVSKYFHSSVDLTVPSGEGSYSKSQAELILKNFFTKNPPSSFAIKHQGASNDGSLFAIGTYTSGALSYRTYFLVKKIGDSYLIHQLEFEEE